MEHKKTSTQLPIEPFVIREGPKILEGRNFESTVRHESVGREGDIILVVVGETGVGKTTFLVHVANAWLGVPFERFSHFLKINRGPEMTSDTTGSYLLILQEGDQRIIIVDTPGLGDTKGIVEDVKHVNNILQAFLRLHHLNAVLFLGKGSDSRYTDRMQYVVEKILGFFPMTFVNKVGLVLTNTAGDPNFNHAKTPLAKWNPKRFVTNNPTKPTYDSEEGEEHACDAWPRSKRISLAILKWCAEQPPASVQVFRDIQAKRDKIASEIDKALQNAQHLSELKNEIEDSKKRKQQAEKEKGRIHSNLKRKVTRTIWVNEPSSYYSTWCRQHPVDEKNVRSACHENCGLPYNPDGGNVFQGCAAMTGNTNCKVCGCGWQSHYHAKDKFVARQVEKEEVDKVVEARINDLQALMSEEEAKLVQNMSSVQKVEHLITLTMRDVVRTASELVVLCNGFDLAQDLSNQVNGLEKRIAVTLDHELKSLLVETKDALEALQKMAARTASATAARSISHQSEDDKEKEKENTSKASRPSVSSFFGLGDEDN